MCLLLPSLHQKILSIGLVRDCLVWSSPHMVFSLEYQMGWCLWYFKAHGTYSACNWNIRWALRVWCFNKINNGWSTSKIRKDTMVVKYWTERKLGRFLSWGHAKLESIVERGILLNYYELWILFWILFCHENLTGISIKSR